MDSLDVIRLRNPTPDPDTLQPEPHDFLLGRHGLVVNSPWPAVMHVATQHILLPDLSTRGSLRSKEQTVEGREWVGLDNRRLRRLTVSWLQRLGETNFNLLQVKFSCFLKHIRCLYVFMICSISSHTHIHTHKHGESIAHSKSTHSWKLWSPFHARLCVPTVVFRYACKRSHTRVKDHIQMQKITYTCKRSHTHAKDHIHMWKIH